jgi:hypothetical protein
MLRLRVDPSAQNAPAWKHEGMRAARIDDGEFEIKVERRSGYTVPHAKPMLRWQGRRLDLDHDRGPTQRHAKPAGNGAVERKPPIPPFGFEIIVESLREARRFVVCFVVPAAAFLSIRSQSVPLQRR